MIPDEEARVIVLPREQGWALTPEGEAALDASLRQTEGEPTVVAHVVSVREEIPRAVAAKATELARERRTTQIAGDPATLL